MISEFKVSKGISIETDDGKHINILPVNIDPNDIIPSTMGSLCINSLNGDIYINRDGNMLWEKISKDVKWTTNEW